MKIKNINQNMFNFFFINDFKLLRNLNQCKKSLFKKLIIEKKIWESITELIYNNEYLFFCNKAYPALISNLGVYIKKILKKKCIDKKMLIDQALFKTIFYKSLPYKSIQLFEIYFQRLRIYNNIILNVLSLVKNTGFIIKKFDKNCSTLLCLFWNNGLNLKKEGMFEVPGLHSKSNILYFFKNIINNPNAYNFEMFNSYFLMSTFKKITNLLVSSLPLTIVNHIKLGCSFGHIPFYEGFLLGGPFSSRGYKPGEIGLSKHLLQSSFEIRYLKNSFLDCIFLFLDHCTDLNSSEQLIYNPSDYKLCYGQGSSVGVGFFLGKARIEYGFNTTTSKNFMNFDYGERY